MSSDEASRTEVACPIREQEQEQEQDEELKRPQKRRKTNLIYKKIKTYESLKLAQDDVKTISSSLVYDRTTEGIKYTKVFYRCKKGCPVRFYLTLHTDTYLVTSYLSDNQHVHRDEDTALNPETRAKAMELIDLGKNLKLNFYLNLTIKLNLNL